MESNIIENDDLLNWSAIQSHILTGAGKLNSYLEPGSDFSNDNLAHYHLKHFSTWKKCYEWKSNGAVSNLISGVWGRTVFVGGWAESGSCDTEAFNLQTPTLFIDMRFPISRPTKQLTSCQSLDNCSDSELQLLSRQHAFGGYTYPERQHPKKDVVGPIFTRHHYIDWNYHPAFPRPRPNQWWVEVKSDQSSFKEYSIANDLYGVPVYYERWIRKSGDCRGEKYLALRRYFKEDASTAGVRDGLLIVVGEHFGFLSDRRTPYPCFAGATGPGGPALIDYALTQIVDGVLPTAHWRNEMVRYLDLEGSYGKIESNKLVPTPESMLESESGQSSKEGQSTQDVSGERRQPQPRRHSSSPSRWVIHRSTHPWLEGQSLWDANHHNQSTNLHDPDLFPQLIWKKHSHEDGGSKEKVEDEDEEEVRRNSPLDYLVWRGERWVALECSFTEIELKQIFFGLSNCTLPPSYCRL